MDAAQPFGAKHQASRSEPAWRVAVRSVAQPLISAGVIPGLIVRVERGDQPPESLCLGTDGVGAPLAQETLFPVASLTKPATALAVLRLADQGSLALDEPLQRHLPDARAAVDGVTPLALLCHTSGLPDDLPEGAAPYALGLDWDVLARAFMATPLETPPWRRVNYSNAGYGLLAVLVERLAGQPFAAASKELVLAPLGVEGRLGEEPARPAAHILGDWGEHLGTALEPFNTPFWRSLALPYGGLVTTAEGALWLVKAFANRPAGFLPPELIAEATRDQTRALPANFVGLMSWETGPWGLGVELRGEKSPHAVAAEASPGSYGHLGVSGAQAWIDPAAGVAWAILGPRLFFEWWQHMPAIGAAILTAEN